MIKGTPVTNVAQSFSFKENASSFGIISSCFHRNQKKKMIPKNFQAIKINKIMSGSSP